jgi:hypothetical protein
MTLLLRCFLLRCLVGICGWTLTFWIAATFFHGFNRYAAAFLFLGCLDRTYKFLFKYPVFNEHETFQTLNLAKS